MDELLTRQELCALLKCSMSLVERLLRERTFPVVKVGRKVLIRRSAVEAWLATQEIPANAQAPDHPPPPERLAHVLEQGRTTP